MMVMGMIMLTMMVMTAEIIMLTNCILLSFASHVPPSFIPRNWTEARNRFASELPSFLAPRPKAKRPRESVKKAMVADLKELDMNGRREERDIARVSEDEPAKEKTKTTTRKRRSPTPASSESEDEQPIMQKNNKSQLVR